MEAKELKGTGRVINTNVERPSMRPPPPRPVSPAMDSGDWTVDAQTPTKPPEGTVLDTRHYVNWSTYQEHVAGLQEEIRRLRLRNAEVDRERATEYGSYVARVKDCENRVTIEQDRNRQLGNRIVTLQHRMHERRWNILQSFAMGILVAVAITMALKFTDLAVLGSRAAAQSHAAPVASAEHYRLAEPDRQALMRTPEGLDVYPGPVAGSR